MSEAVLNFSELTRAVRKSLSCPEVGFKPQHGWYLQRNVFLSVLDHVKRVADAFDNLEKHSTGSRRSRGDEKLCAALLTCTCFLKNDEIQNNNFRSNGDYDCVFCIVMFASLFLLLAGLLGDLSLSWVARRFLSFVFQLGGSAASFICFS